MKKANCVVLTRGTGADLELLKRFLASLYASDFPKDHTLTLVPPSCGLHEGRAMGLEIASKEAEVVVLSDTDIVLPPLQ